ncbi:MAG: hypothetical protein MUF70_14770, partial [Myxococcota bacterium]|nr:hypothetical protein [Myxococcota bacterium]
TQRSDASVLDTLAVALAANGRFEEAVAELDAALALLGPAAPERVAALRARRDAFVQRRPFVETRPDGGAAPTRP